MMRKRRRYGAHHRSKPGTEPGTLVVHSDLALQTVKISVVAFSETVLVEETINKAEDLLLFIKKHPITWINICGLGDVDLLSKIAAMFNLNTLAMEDVVNVHQRPKVEEYDDTFFAVINEPSLVDNELDMQQISIFWGKKFVLTFQERTSDCFIPLVARIKDSRKRSRLLLPEYLAYAVLDTLIDNFFPVIEAYGTHLDDVEEDAIDNASTAVISNIHDFKHNLHLLRRAAWAQREAIASFRGLAVVRDSDLRFFIRDCEDHTIQIIDILESYRERTSGLMDIYLSSINNRTNRIMKVLTIVAATFMPIGVLAGIYGMNFDRSKPWNMPELGWSYGYEYFWGMALLIAGSMLITFWRKGWFKH